MQVMGTGDRAGNKLDNLCAGSFVVRVESI